MKGTIPRIAQLLSKDYGCFKNEVKENMGENPRSRPGFRRKKRKRRSLPADE